ncbi:hypothetical protein BX666DRAFT_2010135 [Dichotomocladium elegans]|nr:hypothetical protein BX666DRAFT_2010135 [Dichotomocladium elegans]
MNQLRMDSSSSKDPNVKTKSFNEEEDHDSADDSDAEKPSKRSGRRKIKIEYIEDKNRRHITFSKRKAGIMKKAYELSTLTGTQVLLLVVSETGLVYTFTTVKLQPIVTKPEGKNLIQACLNAPDPVSNESTSDAGYNNNNESPRVSKTEDKRIDPATASQQQAPAYGGPTRATTAPNAAHPSSYPPQQPYATAAPGSGGPTMPVGTNYSSYMGAAQAQYQQAQASPQGQQGQHPSQQQYGQAPTFYGSQQPHPYMPQHANYWHNTPGSGLQRQDQQRQQEEAPRRPGVPKD